MSSAGLIDLCSDDEICASIVKDVRKRVDSVCRTRKLRKNTENKKVHRRSKKLCAKQNSEEKSSSDDLTTTQIDSSVLDQTCSPDDESRPSSLSSLCPAPICRQFWKAGNYELGQSSRAPTQNGKNHLCIHPMFLHSNATSHKWAFGAIAELLDNAADEIQNGATFVVIDKTTNPRDGRPALLIQDDGGGMDPEAIRRCMSFGFSDKKTKSAIGQYGNGFKTSSMRLGADVIVFTRHLKKRVITQSVGLLSYTFLRQTGHDRIVVPTMDYEFNESIGKLEPLLPHGEEHFLSNLSVLLQWSPYSAKEMLLKQFDDIGQHGTKVVIYNLWLNDDGDTELDFNYDAEDIRINADPKLFQTGQHPRPVSDHHIANLYRYSLRVYSSILYLRLPQSFRIILRGRVVEHHSIANDLKFPEFILYRPHVGLSVEAAVITTIGFLKEAPQVNIHGFNVYHRNRLILPFWRVVKNTTNSNARGVVGVLEANFVEPTHNKQDFEKTSLFQKLEARLKEMALEYWGFHCGLVGYQQLKKSPPAPMPSKELLSFEQPVLLNQSSSVNDSPGTICSVVEPFEDDVITLSNENHHIRSQQRLNMKRKEQRPAVGLEHAKRHTRLRCDATVTQQNGVKQPVNVDEIQSHEVQENEKLRSLLLELERREKDLNLKVNQLINELGDVQHEFTRLLAEAESMGIIKEEKSVNEFSLSRSFLFCL